tara:strand:- start:416 stop:715 length:300 start_codon:yes stop_codon:yes gene_type:complete
MPRGSRSHLTKEGRDKLNFTNKLKKKQDEKKYQQNRNNNGSGGTTTTVSTKTKQGKTRTKAQMLAAQRIAAKKAGTYKKPKTAQELAKERLKIKNKKKK